MPAPTAEITPTVAILRELLFADVSSNAITPIGIVFAILLVYFVWSHTLQYILNRLREKKITYQTSIWASERKDRRALLELQLHQSDEMVKVTRSKEEKETNTVEDMECKHSSRSRP